MRMEKFVHVTPIEGMEECPEDVWINPEQVVYVKDAPDKKGCTLIRMVNATLTVREISEEIVDTLMNGKCT